MDIFKQTIYVDTSRSNLNQHVPIFSPKNNSKATWLNCARVLKKTPVFVVLCHLFFWNACLYIHMCVMLFLQKASTGWWVKVLRWGTQSADEKQICDNGCELQPLADKRMWLRHTQCSAVVKKQRSHTLSFTVFLKVYSF